MYLGQRTLAGTLVLIMVLSTTMISLSVSGEKITYESYIVGNPEDVTTPTEGGLLLAGGSNDIAAAMAWMTEKSGVGDFVVIRCSGTDAYNPWIYKTVGGVDSCETIIFLDSDACWDDVVLAKIRGAEALFIAGGDQWDYVSMWKDTPVEDAIHFVMSKPAPVGGTSAGLAVLGEFSFTAENDTVESEDALMNPYNRRVCLENDFLDMPNMDSIVTDSHFVARDRMGRLVTFLARIVEDDWAQMARGIGIDEKTALGVELNGDVTLFGLCKDGTAAAYFLQTPGPPKVCEPKTPLTYEGISVYKMSIGTTFNIVSWSGEGGAEYTLSAVEGVLTSSQDGGIVY